VLGPLERVHVGADAADDQRETVSLDTWKQIVTLGMNLPNKS